MAHKDDPNAGGLNPALLAHVVADREARPWNYYRLDHDVMKRMLNQQRDTLDHLQAENAQLRADLAKEKKEHDDTFTETEHFAALAERQDREIQVLKADLARVEGERDKLGVELSGAVERSTLILAAKNDWLDRAVAAEASLARLRLQYDALLAALDKAKSWGDVEDAVTAACALQGGEQP